MGRRFEATDQSGDTVWSQDGFEVFRVDDKFKVRDSTLGLHGWLPGRYGSVDEAFLAAALLREMTDDTDTTASARDPEPDRHLDL